MDGTELAFLAALCWAMEAILAKKGGAGLNPIIGSGVGSVVSGGIFLVYIVLTKNVKTAFFSDSSIYFVLAGIVALAMGRVFYFLAIDKTGVSLSVAISGMYPLIASILSFILFREPITPRNFIGIIMISLGGILLFL
jgi:uncharacterized membrane protein